MINIPFKPTDILLPENQNMEKWSVVACDQYTSEPEYWNSVEKFVGTENSTLNLILPEIYLEADNNEEKIEEIHNNMDKYLESGVFKKYSNSLIYVERQLLDGSIRKGIIGAMDLEDYDYSVGSKSLIRATEGTVTSRIPPRLKVRNNASLELPHILILINDSSKNIVEGINKEELEQVYSFDLMKNGGKIEGYLIKDTKTVIEGLESLSENLDESNPLLFAVGDGNHSLATAKAYWEEIKKGLSENEIKTHPARYALAEVGNLHDDSLVFEPIHRVLFNCDYEDLISELNTYYKISDTDGIQNFDIVVNGNTKKLYINNPESNLSVGSLQNFLDFYIKKNSQVKIDYIHGDDVVKELTLTNNNIGFLLPPMDKSDLFTTVIKDGALPRKTFSMGEACEKRFYLEARKIK